MTESQTGWDADTNVKDAEVDSLYKEQMGLMGEEWRKHLFTKQLNEQVKTLLQESDHLSSINFNTGNGVEFEIGVRTGLMQAFNIVLEGIKTAGQP